MALNSLCSLGCSWVCYPKELVLKAYATVLHRNYLLRGSRSPELLISLAVWFSADTQACIHECVPVCVLVPWDPTDTRLEQFLASASQFWFIKPRSFFLCPFPILFQLPPPFYFLFFCGIDPRILSTPGKAFNTLILSQSSSPHIILKQHVLEIMTRFHKLTPHTQNIFPLLVIVFWLLHQTQN